MTGRFTDEQIAATLNRMGMMNRGRQYLESIAHWRLPVQPLVAHRRSHPVRGSALTTQQAADRLGISTSAVQRMIARKLITASQVVPYAPWEIPVDALTSEGYVHLSKPLSAVRAFRVIGAQPSATACRSSSA